MSFKCANQDVTLRIDKLLHNPIQNKFITMKALWWYKYAQMPVDMKVGGENEDPLFITMNKVEPLLFDGVSKTFNAAPMKNPLF